MAVPETKYARNGDVHIAYQAFGEGPITLIGIPPVVSNIEVIWEDPQVARFLRRISGFVRFIHYDKRGQGMSDRDTGIPTIDDRLDDLAAVMDAEGVERAALAGVSEGGATATLFAATHPHRVSHLITFGSFVRPVSHDGEPPGLPPEAYDRGAQLWAGSWARPETFTLMLVAPSMAGDPAFLSWLNRYERQATSPGGLLASCGWIRELDLRTALENVRCPTLVMHRIDDPLVPVEQGRYLHAHVAGSKYLELPGADHVPWYGDQDTVLDAMEDFLVGRQSAPIEHDRMLATVLFTDIVGSTEQAASLGDSRWRRVLDEHDDAVRRHVEAARGRLVKHTGDGILATFDGPVRAIRCAQDLRREVCTLGIDIRAGIHTGEVEVRGEDIGGLAVHIGARVGAMAGAGEVLVSRTVVELVAGSGVDFADRGSHALKGVPGEWQLFQAS